MSENPYSNFDFKNPDYKSIFQKRVNLLNLIKADPKNLAALKIHYKTNPAAFIQDWTITYDPRNVFTDRPAYMPFILFDRQIEYIDWLYHDCLLAGEDGLVEKSRDMGLTWIGCAFSAWGLLFVDGLKVGWGSRKQNLVDTIGDADSIFEKVRIILRHLPGEFLPSFTDPYTNKYRRFDVSKDALFMKIINHKTGASITGEAGENIGRGGRTTIYFKDESAFYTGADSIEAALSQNTDVQIDLSTVNGEGNAFHKKRVGGKVKVFVFDWRDDPRKGEEWYQEQKDKLEPHILAQEVDRDYGAAVENVLIPQKWIKAALNFIDNPTGIKTAGYDVADDGADKNAKAVITGITLTELEEFDYTPDTTRSTDKVYNECKFNKVEYINFDSIGVGAGARGEFNRLTSIEKTNYRPTINAVNVGESPTDDYFDETREYKNKDRLLNLKAQLWWNVRTRFKKTWEHVNGKKNYPMDELISINIENPHELIRELSTPRFEITDNGKIKVESKKDLKKRGVASPNKADAFILCFAPKSTFSLDMF